MGEQMKDKVPAIRFKGFSGEWEVFSVNAACSNFRSGEFIRAENIQQEGKFPVYGGNGLRGYTSHYNHDGSYALIGRQGALCGNMNFSEGKAFFTEHAIAVQANHKNDTNFIYYKLGLMNLGQYSAQSAQPGLSVNKLLELDIFLPIKKEQQKIGDFFKQLDTQLNLHQTKLDKLNTLKQAMLQKMFPQGDATEPEIRFKGFYGEWKCQQLGNISDSFSGGTPTVGVSSYYGGNIPFIRSAEISSSSTQLSLTEEGLANSSAKMVEKGNILYALYGATSGEVGIAKIRGAINQAVLCITPHKGFDAGFLALWLYRQKSQIISTFLQGGQGNLSGSIIKSLMLLVPVESEQQKIGAYFRKLDEFIALERTQLDKLKQIKQACLAGMFV